jgi:ABC-2 type transport system permease protein
VPLVDLLVSAAVLIVAIYFALIGAARIFRAATLMYGKRPNLPELMRWLRAA